MKTSVRWVLFLFGIAVLILCLHYFLVPSWAAYPMIGLRFHRFGPGIFPWSPFIGLLTIFVIGFVLYRVIFPPSSSQATKGKENFCPWCGHKLTPREPDSGKSAGIPDSPEEFPK